MGGGLDSAFSRNILREIKEDASMSCFLEDFDIGSRVNSFFLLSSQSTLILTFTVWNSRLSKKHSPLLRRLLVYTSE